MAGRASPSPADRECSPRAPRLVPRSRPRRARVREQGEAGRAVHGELRLPSSCRLAGRLRRNGEKNG